jgi:hypothetical protein
MAQLMLILPAALVATPVIGVASLLSGFYEEAFISLCLSPILVPIGLVTGAVTYPLAAITLVPCMIFSYFTYSSKNTPRLVHIKRNQS